MKIALIGCTGFVGRNLMARLQSAGHTLVAVVRKKGFAAPWASSELMWESNWSEVLATCDAVVNLAGASVAGGRWTAARKQELFDSRVLVTRRIASSLKGLAKQPRILVNASAVGIYGNRRQEMLGEDADLGQGFLAQLGRAWEREALSVQELGIPVVLARLGVVLGPGGGMLQRVEPIFAWGLGGRLGSGEQWMSWIHISDAVAALEFMLAGGLLGPVNVCSPQPVTNSQFTKSLAAGMKKLAIIPAPAPALRLLLGEMSSLLLDSQRAMPYRLQAAGFRFRYPELSAALAR